MQTGLYGNDLGLIFTCFNKSYLCEYNCLVFIPTMSVPDSISKSNSALAETIVSAFTDFVREDDEDVCPVISNNMNDVVFSIKAALDARFSTISNCFENLKVNRVNKLQSPDPVTFSHTVEVVDNLEEAEPLIIKSVLNEAAVCCNVEVAGVVFISPTVSVFNHSHHIVSKGLSTLSSHSVGLPDGKPREKVGKCPLYSGIVVYFYAPVMAIMVTIGRPTVSFIWGLWPNAIT